jgi:hypothetical protein
VKHRTTILTAIEHGMSNSLIESTNTKIRVITRMAYGFADPQHLIALAMLTLGGHCPPLPGRNWPTDQSQEPLFGGSGRDPSQFLSNAPKCAGQPAPSV